MDGREEGKYGWMKGEQEWKTTIRKGGIKQSKMKKERTKKGRSIIKQNK